MCNCYKFQTNITVLYIRIQIHYILGGAVGVLNGQNYGYTPAKLGYDDMTHIAIIKSIPLATGTALPSRENI